MTALRRPDAAGASRPTELTGRAGKLCQILQGFWPAGQGGMAAARSITALASLVF